MFLDQELKNIQAGKDRLIICCDLRRRLVQIEVQSFWFGIRSSLSNLSLGMAVVDQIYLFWRGRNKK
jgi:hypothetical protein